MKIILELLRRLYLRFLDTRGEMDMPKMTKVKIGNMIYEVVDYFKKASTVTVEDKIFRLMEKELDVSNEICYNEFNTKSKESLDCEADAPLQAVLTERRAYGVLR